jgi:glycosyltransferase involved in cell wall biosynthesis
MNTPCKFSIVTPSFNQAAYIGETIESVLSQAGQFEIEYFVMDGGSTDGSIEIIMRYADQITAGAWPVQCAGITMEWISQCDKGQSDAINQGLRRATGTIASYINSDDLFFPGAFACVAQEFAEHGEADFIYGDGDVIDENGKLQWEWLSRPYDQGLMTSYHFLWNDFTNYIMQQATFWRTRVHGQIGHFDESLHFAMDVEYWVRAGQVGLNLRHVPNKLGKFRLIRGTKSLSSTTAFWGDYLEIFRRYRRRRGISIFFAYYYYTLAKQFDYDIERMPKREPSVFARWEQLPLHECQFMEQEANEGLALACMLVANNLCRQQRKDLAKLAFRRGQAWAKHMAFHPFALLYYLQRAIGPRFAVRLFEWSQRLIRKYRWERYQYRYHQNQ